MFSEADGISYEKRLFEEREMRLFLAFTCVSSGFENSLLNYCKTHVNYFVNLLTHSHMGQFVSSYVSMSMLTLFP